MKDQAPRRYRKAYCSEKRKRGRRPDDHDPDVPFKNNKLPEEVQGPTFCQCVCGCVCANVVKRRVAPSCQGVRGKELEKDCQPFEGKE
jgi:hypothetical protein